MSFIVTSTGHKTYLRVGDSAVTVVVELLGDLFGLSVRDVEATALNQSSEFVLGNHAVATQVQRVKCLVNVEVGGGSETSADGLSGALDLEVNSPHVAELNGSVGQEAVVAAVERVAIVRWASGQHTSVVAVLGKESLLKLSQTQSSVVAIIVAGDEELDFFGSGENTDGGETLSEIVDGDAAAVVLVEDLEGVRQVEIALKSKRYLVGLEFSLELNDVTQAVDELVFLTDVQDGLAAWRLSLIVVVVHLVRRRLSQRRRGASLWRLEAGSTTALAVSAAGFTACLQRGRVG